MYLLEVYSPDDPTRLCRPKAGQSLVLKKCVSFHHHHHNRIHCHHCYLLHQNQGGAPLIWSDEAVTPLVVKSMNWMEEISVSIFSSWVSKLSNEHDGDDQLNGGYLCFNFLYLFYVLYVIYVCRKIFSSE